MAERIQLPVLLRGIAASLMGLLRQGRLGAYLRELRGTFSITQINVFLGLRVGDEARLRRIAWGVLWNRMLGDLDFERLPWADFRVEGTEHLDAALTRGRGVLLCTQHVGPYRRIFFELLRRGLTVNVVVNDAVSRSLRSQLQRRLGSADGGGRLRILNAEQPGSARDILEALRRNEPVLVYLDGNTGVAGPGEVASATANTVEVEFLGQRIAVRRGVCQLARASGAPLLPLFAAWEPGRRPVLRFLEPLAVDRGVPLPEFCRQGMQRLFARSEEHIRRWPEQFEEWTRMHRWKARSAPVPAALQTADVPALAEAQRRYRLAPGRVLLLPVGEGHVLVDGVRGRILQTTPLLLDLARVLRRNAVSAGELQTRLERRHPRPQLAEAVRRLKALELIEEVPS